MSGQESTTTVMSESGSKGCCPADVGTKQPQQQQQTSSSGGGNSGKTVICVQCKHSFYLVEDYTGMNFLCKRCRKFNYMQRNGTLARGGQQHVGGGQQA